MPDPITIAIATAIAGKTAESLTDQAREAVTEIVHRVRRKFRHRPADLAALDTARANPGSVECTALARSLQQVMLEDPRFGTSIRTLWSQAQMEMMARDNDVVNIFRGRADKVVQLRDIHGDLNIS